MTPFHRLGLYTAAAIVAGAIAYVGDVVSLWVGVASLVGGAILALLATLELQLDPPKTEEPKENGQADFAMRRRDRRDIERSASASRETGE